MKIEKVFGFKKYPLIPLRNFLKKNSSNKKTLDLGCKNSPYRKYFPNSTGLDIEEGKYVDYVGDAHNMDCFEDNLFEQVVCIEVLEHLYDPQKAINEMYRVLKPGGKLILTTRFIFPIHDSPHDYFRYTKYGLRHLVSEANFKNIKIEEETTSIGAIAIILQRMGFQTEQLYFAPLRLLWLILAQILWIFRNTPSKEFGIVPNKQKTSNILSSGYYVTAFKK